MVRIYIKIVLDDCNFIIYNCFTTRFIKNYLNFIILIVNIMYSYNCFLRLSSNKNIYNSKNIKRIDFRIFFKNCKLLLVSKKYIAFFMKDWTRYFSNYFLLLPHANQRPSSTCNHMWERKDCECVCVCVSVSECVCVIVWVCANIVYLCV